MLYHPLSIVSFIVRNKWLGTWSQLQATETEHQGYHRGVCEQHARTHIISQPCCLEPSQAQTLSQELDYSRALCWPWLCCYLSALSCPGMLEEAATTIFYFQNGFHSIFQCLQLQFHSKHAHLGIWHRPSPVEVSVSKGRGRCCRYFGIYHLQQKALYPKVGEYGAGTGRCFGGAVWQCKHSSLQGSSLRFRKFLRSQTP